MIDIIFWTSKAALFPPGCPLINNRETMKNPREKKTWKAPLTFGGNFWVINLNSHHIKITNNPSKKNIPKFLKLLPWIPSGCASSSEWWSRQSCYEGAWRGWWPPPPWSSCWPLEIEGFKPWQKQEFSQVATGSFPGVVFVSGVYVFWDPEINLKTLPLCFWYLCHLYYTYIHIHVFVSFWFCIYF